MDGYTGSILSVDLGRGTSSVEPLSPNIAQSFLGGKGLGGYLLYRNLSPHTDAFDPENVVVFATGPFTGTPIQAGSRTSIITKSPLTGTICDSYGGGFWGPRLKFSGFDALVIKGKANKPVYIYIHDGNCVLKPADHLWGLRTSETQERILQEILDNESEIICIGPAGENKVRFGCMISGKHAFARGGAGAVMGIKGLKAIAVSGNRSVTLANTTGLMERRMAIQADFAENLFTSILMPQAGTPPTMGMTNTGGVLPTRNFQSGVFPGADLIADEALVAHHVADRACFGCPLICTKVNRILKGPKAGLTTEGPEYETLFALGSCCGIDDLDALLEADRLCDEYGMDTMSTGVTIAFAMECFDRGLLTQEETGGIQLSFGNAQALTQLIPMIARREGLGVLLAEGTKRMAQMVGSESISFAMQVKGLEMAGYEPRGMKGQGLAYAVGTRGACHKRGSTIGPELTGSSIGEEVTGHVDRFGTDGKAMLVKTSEDTMAVIDSMGICYFATFAGLGLAEMASLYSYITGFPATKESMAEAGERIHNLFRLFNIREGFSRQEDTLPPRILHETLPDGPAKGRIFSAEELEMMLSTYYQLRGYDIEGIPTREKLRGLSLNLWLDSKTEKH